MKGAAIVVQVLLEQGVERCFGYPGAVLMPLYDELYRVQDRLPHILTAHEQGAVHAADGYARTTGRVGVCIATSGPGATNLVTGIAAAFLDSTPLVCITGQVPLDHIGTDSFQEVDTTGITMPITKHNAIVRSADELASVLRYAFKLAIQGRPGPVVIDIPGNVLLEEGHYEPEPPILKQRPPLDLTQMPYVERAAGMLSKARHPCILVGGGVIASDAVDVLKRLAHRLQAPVVTTLMGVGGYPASDPLWRGMLGMHGITEANRVLAEADVVLAVGTRFSDRGGGDMRRLHPKAKVIHVDIDRAEISKTIHPIRYLVGDAQVMLEALEQKLTVCRPEKIWTPCKVVSTSRAAAMMLEIYRHLPQARWVTDVGQHQLICARTIPFDKPRQLITNGGLGAMGFGLGAAIGAAMADPGRPVVLVVGDGGFRMSCQELATLSAYPVPMVIAVMNNGVLGMVRQSQTRYFGGRYSQTILNRGPDFVKLAEAYGLRGVRITEVGAIDEALKGTLPVVLDIPLEADDMVIE